MDDIGQMSKLSRVDSARLQPTDQKRNGAAQPVNEARLRVLLAGLPDVILRLDRDGILRDLYTSRPGLLYRSVDQFVGRRVADIVPDVLMSIFAQVVRTGRQGGVEYELDASRGLCQFEARVLFHPPEDYLMIIREVTEQKLTEARLARAHRMTLLARRASGVAHEINNPLAYAAARLELLSERIVTLELPASQRTELLDALHTVEVNVQRANRLVADLGVLDRPDERRRKALEFRQDPDRPPVEASRSAGPTPVVTSLFVLVIDDESDLLQIVRDALPEHRVCLAATGREARALLDSVRFDVILCDLMLPDVSGLDLYAYIAAARPELADRLGWLTGGAFTHDVATFLERAQRPVLRKPFTLAQLRGFVRALATSGGAQQPSERGEGGGGVTDV